MGKRNMYIDHEEYKLKIKLSASTYMLLQQDMYRFGFLKENEEININYFINYILPIIYRYRKSQDEKLEKLITKYLKDIKSINKIIYEMNDFYYEDVASYHNEIINLRISKNNMNLFNNIFNETNIKKSTFFRSLINQYSSLKLDIREFLCFNNEYHMIEDAINKYNIIIDFLDTCINIYPIDIIACPIDSELFVFGLIIIENKLWIKSIRLCEINNIQKKEEVFSIKLNDMIKQNIDDFILGLEYLEKDFKELGDI